MNHAAWGPKFSEQQIADLLAERRDEIELAGCRIAKMVDERSLCEYAARAIAEGKVLGWFQGRMEWGPRALGNRSIVCDPRRADMKAILNAKIKRRESFRPFAPSVLSEAVVEWFEENDAVPFMMQVFQIREEKRSQIPAVTHVDGSGAAANRRARCQSSLPPTDRSLPRSDRCALCCSTRRSTKMNLLSASRRRRSIASYGPRWTSLIVGNIVISRNSDLQIEKGYDRPSGSGGDERRIDTERSIWLFVFRSSSSCSS